MNDSSISNYPMMHEKFVYIIQRDLESGANSYSKGLRLSWCVTQSPLRRIFYSWQSPLAIKDGMPEQGC